jgi:hypothetical protein
MKTSTELAMDDSGDPSGAIPEMLLPVQFVELFQRSSGRMPELALMAAVLEDAILSFCRCADSRGVSSQQLFQETAEWFESPDVTWPFAFENICDALALEAEWIRGLLRRWQDDQRTAAKRPATIPTCPKSSSVHASEHGDAGTEQCRKYGISAQSAAVR